MNTYRIVKTVAYAMFAAGLVYSVSHIFDLFHNILGSTVLAAALMPAFIDGGQLVGRLIQGEAFAADTRRIGKGLQFGGALVSLAANVIAGHALGDRIAGAVIVVGYVGIELLAERIRPAQDDAQAASKLAAADLAAKRSASAKQAAATRRANAAKKAPAKRKPTTRAARAAEVAQPALDAIRPEPAYI